jgi:hypothetical protein
MIRPAKMAGACRCFSAALLALLLAGCASTGGEGGMIDLKLKAGQQNRGNIATVVLAAQGEETALTFFIGGVPPGTTLPLQLETYIYPGSCARLGERPVFAMNGDIHATRVNAGWTLRKLVPAPLASLRGGSHAVVVRTTPANSSLDIFCGEIP